MTSCQTSRHFAGLIEIYRKDHAPAAGDYLSGAADNISPCRNEDDYNPYQYAVHIFHIVPEIVPLHDLLHNCIIRIHMCELLLPYCVTSIVCMCPRAYVCV
jgi:hypothetical protein